MSTNNLTTANVTLETGYTYDLITDSYMSDNIVFSNPFSNGSLSISPTWGNYSVNNHDPTIVLDGSGIKLDSNSDVTFGNTSLKSFMENVEKRLAILNVNPALESDWEELKTLGDQYRELEKKIYEKLAPWNILKKDD